MKVSDNIHAQITLPSGEKDPGAQQIEGPKLFYML
jgi:hypothetical protein